MSKSLIITVTQGDFDYIDEWIDHHHNLGVDQFLIAYNGPTEKFREYKEREYVKFIDFSYNKDNKKEFYDSKFSAVVEKQDISYIYYTRQIKIINLLFDYAKCFYRNEYDYLFFIDIDEFVNIKNPKYTNINDYLDCKFPKENSSITLEMNFASDGDLIYKDNRPCSEKFKETHGRNYFNYGAGKIIIRLNHPHTLEENFKYISPHFCSRWLYRFNLNFDDIELTHYWTKSLEEWIEKMNPEIDSDYFRRFRGKIFHEYFFGGSKINKMTKEKLEAIPALLKKYNIDYDFLNEETEEFKTEYNRIMNNG